MGDPLEGLTAAGMIRTGAAPERIDERYRPLLDELVSGVIAVSPQASVYIFGSVATGQAMSPGSDVDLLTVGLPAEAAADLSTQLSATYAHLCRSVDIGAGRPSDLIGEGDEAYGNRVFRRHYCVHLGGPDDTPACDFAGDRRAARGFNGDIARHAARWSAANGREESAMLGRRVARKLLLAVAALVSVHDHTWTTDRAVAARRWGEIHPDLAPDLDQLLGWVSSDSSAGEAAVDLVVRGLVGTVVHQFDSLIGLWDCP